MGRCTVDGANSVCAAEGDSTMLVCLVGTICYGVRGEEGFFPCHPRLLGMTELLTSLAFSWEGEGGAERAVGYGSQVPAFDGAVGLCSLILHLFYPTDVLRHAGSLVPPRGHGEADIDSVCIVKDVAVVSQVVKELSCGDLVVVGVKVLELDEPRLLHGREDEAACLALAMATWMSLAFSDLNMPSCLCMYWLFGLEGMLGA